MKKLILLLIILVTIIVAISSILPDLFGCDTWVALRDATARGAVLFAKNSDRTIFDSQPLALHPRHAWPEGESINLGRLSIPQVRETFATLGSGPYWCWGYEEGINEFSVVIGNEGVYTKPLQEAIAAAREGRGPKPGPTGMDLVRLGLERSRTARQAVETIADLTERFGQFGSGLPGKGLDGAYDNSYLIADPGEAWILETAGTRWAARKIEKGVASISNTLSLTKPLDLAAKDLSAYAQEKGWWPGGPEASFDFGQAYLAIGPDQTAARQRSLVRSGCSLGLLQKKAGAVDESWMMRIARDRSTSPSLDLDVTAGSCVAALPAREADLPIFWWCASVPSSGVYIPFFVHGSKLPTIISAAGTVGKKVIPPETAPTDRFSPESFWWIFRDLSDLVNIDRPARLKTVRAEFDALEHEYAAELPNILKSASALRHEGRIEEASTILDEFTARCVEKAVVKAKALRASFKIPNPENAGEAGVSGIYLANFGSFVEAEWTVSSRDGRLFLEMPGRGALELRPPDKNGFHALVLTDQAGVSFIRHPAHGLVAMTFRQGTAIFELPRKGVVLPPEIPLDQLTKHLGKYYGDKLNETLEIVMKNNALALKIPGQKTYELRSPDAQGRWFFRVVGTIHLTFQKSASGDIESFDYYEGGSVLSYKKVPGDQGFFSSAIVGLGSGGSFKIPQGRFFNKISSKNFKAEGSPD